MTVKQRISRCAQLRSRGENVTSKKKKKTPIGTNKTNQDEKEGVLQNRESTDVLGYVPGGKMLP